MGDFTSRELAGRAHRAPADAAGEPVPGRTTRTAGLGDEAAPEAVHAAARRGVETESRPLPFASSIQRAFGHHDISSVRAHVGDEAAAAARAMGAAAYATGDRVVLPRDADLATVAHEVAHVVQQRGGASVPSGVGAAGDAHERHADEVAALVVQGKSAEALLDRYAKPRAQAPSGAAPVQRMLTPYDKIVLKRGAAGALAKKDMYEWKEHETQGKTADRHQLPTVAHGLGGPLDGHREASMVGTPPTYSAPNAGTGEASRVQVDELGPHVVPARSSTAWNRLTALDGAAGGAGLYAAVGLLPAQYGGAWSTANYVALPIKEKKRFVNRVQNRVFDRLVGTARAWISYTATAAEQVENIGGVATPYTSAVTVAWDELDDCANKILGTRGELTIDVPAPSQVGAGVRAPRPNPPPQLAGRDNRAVTPAPRDKETAVSWRTEVAWGETHRSGDGTVMEARRLGPDHRLGTEPAHRDKKAKKKGPYIWDQRTNALAEATDRTFVAGHLLNHHVGGPGNDARNLVAIPGDVNSKMAGDVEAPVKKLVNHEHAWIYYRAEATHAPDVASGLEYASVLAFQWHQLDARTGEPVPSTAGSAKYTIDPPSTIATDVAAARSTAQVAAQRAGLTGKKLASATKAADLPSSYKPTLALPTLATAQDDTAKTTPAYDEVVLEEAKTLRPILIYQKHLLGVLRSMETAPHFMRLPDAALKTTLGHVIAAHKPGPKEERGLGDDPADRGRLGLLDPKQKTDLEKFAQLADDLERALDTTNAERKVRVASLSGALQAHVHARYKKAFAAEVEGEFATGLKLYTDDIDHGESLVRQLVAFARSTTKRALGHGNAVLEAVNELRGWLGEPLHGDDADTEMMIDDVVPHTESLVRRTADYMMCDEGSPGQEWEQFAAESGGAPPDAYMDVKRGRVEHATKAHAPIPNASTLHPPSDTRKVLAALLQSKAVEFLNHGAALKAYGVHERVARLAFNLTKAPWDDWLHPLAVAEIYESNIPGTQLYLAEALRLFGGGA